MKNSVILIAISLLLSSPAMGEELVLTVGGDVCLNKSKWKPRADGAGSGSYVTSWEKLTSGIAPLLNGDFNFGNLETVVVEDKPLSAVNKKYTFQSHLNGVKYLAKIGFNLFSLANNHSYDFGEEGAKSTLKALKTLKKDGVYSAGLGHNVKEAIAPEIIHWKGKTIAFSAVGIITNMNKGHRAGKHKAGTVRYRDKTDYALVLDALKNTQADLKLLSIHFGTERKTRLDRGQRARFERAVREAGVDVVIGHHAHVVRAVQKTKQGEVLFYGLGNYLIRGARDMTPLPDESDYGLFSRIYLNENPKTGAFEVQAVEAIPLTHMHHIAKPMKPADGKRRLEVLNGLSVKSLQDEALLFTVRDDGTGIHCFGGNPGPRAQKACGLTLE